MHRMVAPEDLSVVFQPIVRLPDARPFGYEAFVRCRAPAFANPLVLFEQAVAAGCAGRLGRMIREIAVGLAGSTPLFVNVHPQELSEGWLVRPDDPIFRHDDEVFLEITESVPLTHFDLCLSVLKEVRSRGAVHLVVDDLGAGYSNLKRIADLEPRVVKLDRALIAGLERSARQRQLVANVVRLCKRLDARVVAEGVETLEEHAALCAAGADLAQGYLYARPGYPIPSVHVPVTR
ncbi:MAG: EAL domain-containing protein [Polyangiaceae bacterium]